jgi:hypothetical protein
MSTAAFPPFSWRKPLRLGLVLLFALVSFALPRPLPAAEERAIKVSSTAQPAPGAQRLALVIGNGEYKTQRLANSINDGRDMAQTLRGLGFEVIEKIDASLQDMEEAISAFGRAIQKGGVALFYFAGHGVQVNGRNYLIPVDARIETESDVKYKAVDAGLVMGKMEDGESGVNIVILDACRNNPFGRAFRRSLGSRGLAQMDAPRGTLIVYATSPGAEASDGDERNGVFTKHLLQELKIPNQSISQALQRVRAQVIQATDGKQTPWESSSLTGDFFPAGRSETSATQDFTEERRRIAELQAQLEAERRRMEEERGRLGAGREPIAIGAMELGQKAWIDPQAMYVDKGKKIWLRSDYKAAPWPIGDMTMLVERAAEGFSVDLGGVKHKWESGREADPKDLPVANLRYKKTVLTVADMQVGQKAWVKADALFADMERKLWLKSGAVLASEAKPEAPVQVERTESGYTVDVTKVQKRAFAKNVAAKEKDLPVEKLVY